MSAARHVRVYRALLRLYPRAFRTGYAEPMTQLFADRLAVRGRRVWLEIALDLVRTVPVQRMEAVMARMSPVARIAALVVIVFGAVVVSVGAGTGAAPLLVVLAAIAALVALATQRRVLASAFGQRAPLRAAVTQAWWAPVAGLLGLAFVVFAVGTVFEADNMGGRIFGTSILMAFGVSMLFGLMRRPFDRTVGNSMILLATMPAFPFFWLVVPTLAALVVWAGVLGSGFSDQPAPAPIP